MTVTTERDCTWEVRSDAGWITITTAGEIQGSGTVRFVVAATSDPVSRTASLNILDKQVAIVQRAAACEYEISALALALPAAGGGSDIDVAASSPMCEWTAQADAGWVSIPTGRTYKGSGRVSVQAAAWAGPDRRATLVIAGQQVAVTQSDGCVYNVTPSSASMPASGAHGSVSIQTPEGCGWSAASGASWVRISSAAAGTGPATAQFDVDANSGPARSARLTIANRAVTIAQASGCAYRLDPPAAAFGAPAAASSIAVQTAAGCAWTAVAEAGWMTITSGASGSGPGVVQLNVAANAGPERAAAVRVANQRFAASQASGCNYALSVTSWPFFGEGQVGYVTVTTGPDCPWTASSQVDWISLTSSASVIGSGDIHFYVAPNPGAQRAGTLIVAGQTYTAIQYPAGGGN